LTQGFQQHGDLPSASESWEDPTAMLAILREEDPVHWLAGVDAWLLTRHEDVRACFADPRVTPDPRVYEHYSPPSPGFAAHWIAEIPFLSARTRAGVSERSLVYMALLPRCVARMESVVRDVVEEFAAPLRDRRDVVDLVATYSAPIPGAVIGRILGVPPAGADEAGFRKLARKTVRGINPLSSEKKRRKTEQATRAMAEYVCELVAERRRAPRDDLLSELVRASEKGEPADDRAIARAVVGLVSAGTDSVAVAGTRAIRSLLQNEGELCRLRDDSSLLPTAILELLRYDIGLVGMPRYVCEDLELRGKALHKGQLLILSFTGAHRDPRVFSDPDRLDLRRQTKSSDLLVFGHGPHYCVGSNLARLELRVMLEAILKAMPEGARLLEEQVRWGAAGGLLGRIKTLPVDFGT